MPVLRNTATVTAKGQITLPKPIRQALGVESGDKVTFELRGDTVVVGREESPGHVDPAIGAFLDLLEKDIAAGRHVTDLPCGLAEKMVQALKYPVGSDEIEDPVSL